MPEAAPAAPAAPAATPAAVPPPPAAPAASPSPASMAGAPPPAPPAGAAPDGKQADAPKPDAFALKLPEGADKRFDPKALEKFKGIMADPKTTAAEKAQALVEMRHAELIAEDKAITEYMEKTRTANLEALKGDPEFGGAKFDRTVANAKSALQQFGGEEVSKLCV